MTTVHAERLRGGAGELHGREPGVVEQPALWWCEIERPAVVLGSRQPAELLDLDRCRRQGIEVVRRRSGGGLVVLLPGDVVWVDLLLPPAAVLLGSSDVDGVGADDVRTDDVRAVMVRVGEWWRDALGGGACLTVHRDGLARTAWSDLVCFAGIGPGEVLERGHKLVGLSQRRGRWGARIQCAVHRRVDLRSTAHLLVGEHPPLGSLPTVAVRPALDAGAVVEALVGWLSTSVATA